MEEFSITEDLQNLRNFKQNGNRYEVTLNSLPNQEVILSIDYMPDWNTEVGQCYEFAINNYKVLLAFCTDKEDFLRVFNSFYG